MSYLLHKPTSERTEKELEISYEQYILSKTVNGRYCPTPDLLTHDEEYEYGEEYEYNKNNKHTTTENKHTKL